MCVWYVVVVQARDFVNKQRSKCTDLHVSLSIHMLVLILAAVKYSIQKAMGKEREKEKISLLLLVKGESSRERKEEEWRIGGRVNTPRLSHVWHPRSLKEGRTDTKPVRPSRSDRGEGGREGRGNKCKTTGREKRVKKMHKSCISSCPQGTKNIVFVNGSWWAQPQGEGNEKPGRLQSLVLLSSNPLSLCLSVCLCQLDLSLGYDLAKGFRAFD